MHNYGHFYKRILDFARILYLVSSVLKHCTPKLHLTFYVIIGIIATKKGIFKKCGVKPARSPLIQYEQC